ncbi:MAG TPA: hypothetical protein VK876_06160 [Rubrivivax sp.]|nr:hypothetical protein [Rubrivivax sp.]
MQTLEASEFKARCLALMDQAHQATLITADTAIRRWRNELPRHDARR